MTSKGTSPRPSDRTESSAESIRVVFTLPSLLGDDDAETLRDDLYDLLRTPGTPVTLDANGVEGISTTGIGVLIAAALVAQSTGSTLHIRRPSDAAIRRVPARYEHVAEILDGYPPTAGGFE